jgi:hypothetical protein
MPKRISQRLKRLIIDRSSGCCEYCLCQEQYSPVTFSVEHIVPKSRGGTISEDNLAFSCQECNNHKYNKTGGIDPVSGEEVVLFHPRLHVWNEHFVWNDDYTIIIGTSPIGRVTVELLHLNKLGVINLRRILQKAGKHPPTFRA